MTIALERPKKTISAQIREQLGYPIIDTDVHTQEFEPAFLDYLAQVGGSKTLGSDSGHWDVPDITAVTSNAYSMVQRGILTEEDLQYFLSIHPLELYTSLNRDFFKGTAIEKQAEEYLASVANSQ